MDKQYNLKDDQVKLVEDIKRNGDESYFRGVVVTKLSYIENRLDEGVIRFDRHSKKILFNRISIATICGGLIVIGLLLKIGVIKL